MTRPKRARINELNICKKIIQEEIERVKGTDHGMLVYGMRHAIKILMDHKKAIRPETINTDCGPCSLDEQRAHAARMKGDA